MADNIRTPRPSSIQLNAIINNAAVLTINGKQQLLSKNARSAEGYKLVKIGEDRVTLLISGQAYEYQLGAGVTASKAGASGKIRVDIYRGADGMFQTPGQVNGQPVKFLIDTGATSVAISSVLANELGIDYLDKGIAHKANTAAGVVNAYKVVLNNVSVGELTLYRVEAAIIEGSFPRVPLLGMSFLQRVKLHDEGVRLILEEKH